MEVKRLKMRLISSRPYLHRAFEDRLENKHVNLNAMESHLRVSSRTQAQLN
jgi:hypothetical protein